MKEGERFTFQLIPRSLRGKIKRTEELVIPINNTEWWDRKFMTQAPYGGSNANKIWYFMALNPAYQKKEDRVAYGNPFIFQKMYADIDLESGRGVVGQGEPFQYASTGGSFNPSLERGFPTLRWLSEYDIFIITKEASLMNWDILPWRDLK